MLTMIRTGIETLTKTVSPIGRADRSRGGLHSSLSSSAGDRGPPHACCSDPSPPLPQWHRVLVRCLGVTGLRQQYLRCLSAPTRLLPPHWSAPPTPLSLAFNFLSIGHAKESSPSNRSSRSIPCSNSRKKCGFTAVQCSLALEDFGLSVHMQFIVGPMFHVSALQREGNDPFPPSCR